MIAPWWRWTIYPCNSLTIYLASHVTICPVSLWPDRSTWHGKVQRRTTALLLIALAVACASSLAKHSLTSPPVTIKLGQTLLRNSIICLSAAGDRVERIDYDIYLGTSSVGGLPTSTRVQVHLSTWPHEGVDPKGKPTRDEAIKTIHAEFAAACAQHGCPEVAAQVNLIYGGRSLTVPHTQYASRLKWSELFDGAVVLSLMIATASAIGLCIALVERWRAWRTLPAWCCLRCGYDLRGLRGRSCPECGGPSLTVKKLPRKLSR